MKASFLFCNLLWAVMNTEVYGDYLFKLELKSIANPSNSVAAGDCCEEVEDSCSEPCVMNMRLCIRPADFSHADLSCPLLEIYGNVRPRGLNLAFLGPWPGSVQLYIRVTHTIGGVDTHQVLTDDLLIDNLFIEVANLTSFSPLTPVELFTGEAGRVEAELQFGVVCDGNCYGPDCSVECNSRNDSTAHYRCDRNGDWECMDGYQDLATNCTKCLPAVGCLNGDCDGPGNCVCEEGWGGDLCTDCIPSDGCSPSGGYCDLPGQCLCREGYSGDNCAIAAAPSSSVDSTSSSTHLVVLLPTVEGVRPSAATANGVSITILPIIVVAAVGGALLLLIIIISFITLVVATCNRNPTSHRKGLFGRVYVISTTGSDGNGTAQHDNNDENQLVSSTTSTTSNNYYFQTDVTFSTFQSTTADSPPVQTTPLPGGERAREGETGSVGRGGDREEEEEEEEEEEGVQCVEMDFPSGYTDPEKNLDWLTEKAGSVQSGQSEQLSWCGSSEGELSHTPHNLFTSSNQYQIN